MCHHARLGLSRTRRVAYPTRPCRRPPDWSSPALPLRRRAHCHRALPDARVPQVSSHATAIRRAGAGPSCCTHRSVLAALRRPCLSCPPASTADTRPRSGPSRTPSEYCISMGWHPCPPHHGPARALRVVTLTRGEDSALDVHRAPCPQTPSRGSTSRIASFRWHQPTDRGITSSRPPSRLLPCPLRPSSCRPASGGTTDTLPSCA